LQDVNVAVDGADGDEKFVRELLSGESTPRLEEQQN
jgi:hypothetical protein